MGEALRVLLVEDNPDHAELIARSLRRSLRGLSIKHARTQAECLSILKNRKYDTLLMDYYLPDSTGTDFIRQLSQQYPELPVIIITGQGDERTAAKSIKAGAEDYVVKTRESLEALPKILTRSLQKHRARLEHKKKLAKKKASHQKNLSGFFKEFEAIRRSLKTIYRRLNGKPSPKSPPHAIKRLPMLEKQLITLKGVMRKLFLGNQ